VLFEKCTSAQAIVSYRPEENIRHRAPGIFAAIHGAQLPAYGQNNVAAYDVSTPVVQKD